MSKALFVILFIVVLYVYRSQYTVTTASAEVIGLSVDFGGAMPPKTATAFFATLLTIKQARCGVIVDITSRPMYTPHVLPGARDFVVNACSDES